LTHDIKIFVTTKSIVKYLLGDLYEKMCLLIYYKASTPKKHLHLYYKIRNFCGMFFGNIYTISLFLDSNVFFNIIICMWFAHTQRTFKINDIYFPNLCHYIRLTNIAISQKDKQNLPLKTFQFYNMVIQVCSLVNFLFHLWWGIAIIPQV